jgi:hypothetical protein
MINLERSSGMYMAKIIREAAGLVPAGSVCFADARIEDENAEVLGANFDKCLFFSENSDLLEDRCDVMAKRESLQSKQQRNFLKSDLAQRILAAAADGERDPIRLREQALATTD